MKGAPPEEGFEEKQLQVCGAVGRIIGHVLQTGSRQLAPLIQLAEELASDPFVKREITAIKDGEVQEAVLDELTRRIDDAAGMKDLDVINQFGWTSDDRELDFEVMELASELVRERFKRIFKNTLQFGREVET